MIGTFTEELIVTLDEIIGYNEESIPPVRVGLNSVRQILDGYEPSVNGLEGAIVDILNTINGFHAQQVAIGIAANDAGCGISGVGTERTCTIGVTTVYATSVYYTDYTYELNDPWEEVTGLLNDTTIGRGWKLDFVEVDTAVAIGTYCTLDFSCPDAIEEIADLQLLIDELVPDIPTLIDAVRPIIRSRSDFFMEEFAFRESINDINNDTARLRNTVNRLENPRWQPYFLDTP